MQWKFVFAGFVGLALSSNALGMIVGNANSPRYGSELGAVAYLHSHVRYVLSADEGLVRLDLKSGLRKYSYRVADKELNVQLRSVQEISSLQSSRNRLLELDRFDQYLGLGALVPTGVAPAALAIYKTTKEPPLLKYARRGGRRLGWKIVLPAAALFGSAGFFGYSIAYKDTADWDNDVVLSVLKNPDYYANISDSYNRCDLSSSDKKRHLTERLVNASLEADHLHIDPWFLPRYEVEPFDEGSIEKLDTERQSDSYIEYSNPLFEFWRERHEGPFTLSGGLQTDGDKKWAEYCEALFEVVFSVPKRSLFQKYFSFQ